MIDQPVLDYWAAHYIENHVCSLCGNTGKIDTRDSAKSLSGLKVGRVNFCICPAGQILRDNAEPDPPETETNS